jgi:hypothetical protein
VEPANLVFVRFADQWHRLYFDYATVFWREDSDGPQGFVAEEIDASYRPVDLGTVFSVQGVLQSNVLDVAAERRGGSPSIQQRHTVRFECKDDVTRYSV